MITIYCKDLYGPDLRCIDIFFLLIVGVGLCELKKSVDWNWGRRIADMFDMVEPSYEPLHS